MLSIVWSTWNYFIYSTLAVWIYLCCLDLPLFLGFTIGCLDLPVLSSMHTASRITMDTKNSMDTNRPARNDDAASGTSLKLNPAILNKGKCIFLLTLLWYLFMGIVHLLLCWIIFVFTVQIWQLWPFIHIVDSLYCDTVVRGLKYCPNDWLK